jgi:hypothetical protein
MLTTDAYAFLNINDPVCAWATYRRVLVSAPEEPGGNDWQRAQPCNCQPTLAILFMGQWS